MRILVVEDEFMIAMDLKAQLEALDNEVVGPVGRRGQALALARSEELDGALLDINLNNGDALEVAEVLQARSVPFAFVTGYQHKELPGTLNGAPRLLKPLQKRHLQEIVKRFAAEPPE